MSRVIVYQGGKAYFVVYGRFIDRDLFVPPLVRRGEEAPGFFGGTSGIPGEPIRSGPIPALQGSIRL